MLPEDPKVFTGLVILWAIIAAIMIAQLVRVLIRTSKLQIAEKEFGAGNYRDSLAIYLQILNPCTITTGPSMAESMRREIHYTQGLLQRVEVVTGKLGDSVSINFAMSLINQLDEILKDYKNVEYDGANVLLKEISPRRWVGDEPKFDVEVKIRRLAEKLEIARKEIIEEAQKFL